ncbi:hypothetical protein PXO_04394 [Xanthomonas oryzae pv. oryzae PXO99A]|uniref:Uncharacterized protein n=2 Tax=Xanthomonas oryzae TaxID=347 RepID=A0A0K0GHK7_XANOP|nr:hypothetical protein PXO_04394 [Xanthomonas oryzae pv. oryzae PXO99A]
MHGSCRWATPAWLCMGDSSMSKPWIWTIAALAWWMASAAAVAGAFSKT